MDELRQACPHCTEHPPAAQLDDHVAAAHTDIPPCTASLTSETAGGPLYCAFRVGHQSPDYGDWHASRPQGPAGRTVWNDSASGAAPHQAA